MSHAAAADPGGATRRWREVRRESARKAIVDAAWESVRADGLAGLSIRDLARRAGITTPTIYAYFESKHAIYDAMFRQAAEEFADRMTGPYEQGDPRDVLVAGLERFVEFCTSDPTRYQLLFQRTIPGFEPSAEAYAPAVRSLDSTRERLAANRITDRRHLDLWTALTTGLVNQQISNDPGGTRWSGLVEEAADMFLAHCRRSNAPTRSRNEKATSRGRQEA